MIICRNPYRPKDDPSAAYPCGRCLACRYKMVSDWTIRMTHERETRGSAHFLTLTYDNKHINPHYSLRKRDIQLFFKRLRKKIDYKFTYYVCGEYGPRTHRPHYHMILFGIRPDDLHHIYSSWTLCDPINGIHLEEANTRKACAYVAGYVNKKLGKRYSNLFKKQYPNKEPEFSLCSQGLGYDWCFKHSELYKTQKVMYENGHRRMLPRYYRKKLGIELDDLSDLMIDTVKSTVDAIIERTQCEMVRPYEMHDLDDYLWMQNITLFNEYQAIREICNEKLERKLKDTRTFEGESE